MRRFRIIAFALTCAALLPAAASAGPNKPDASGAETPEDLARMAFRALKDGKLDALERGLLTAADVEAALATIRRADGDEAFEAASEALAESGGAAKFAESRREKPRKGFEQTLADARELDEPIDWSRAEFGGLIGQGIRPPPLDGMEYGSLHFWVRVGERRHAVVLEGCRLLDRGWVCVGFIRLSDQARPAAEEPVPPPPSPFRELSPGATALLRSYCDLSVMRGSREVADEARKRAEEFEAGAVPDDGQIFLGLMQAVASDCGPSAQAGIECLCALGKYDEARKKADEWNERFRSSDYETRCEEMAALCRKLGKKAPAIQAEGWAESEDFSLADASGEVVLLYFRDLSKRWSEKLERVLDKRLFERYADRGFRIVGLSKHLQFDHLTGRKDESFGLKEEIQQLGHWKYNFKTPWPLGLSPDDRNHEAYGVRALPSYALVGRDGRYRFYFCDASQDALDVLAAVIERLLAE